MMTFWKLSALSCSALCWWSIPLFVCIRKMFGGRWGNNFDTSWSWWWFCFRWISAGLSPPLKTRARIPWFVGDGLSVTMYVERLQRKLGWGCCRRSCFCLPQHLHSSWIKCCPTQCHSFVNRFLVSKGNISSPDNRIVIKLSQTTDKTYKQTLGTSQI